MYKCKQDNQSPWKKALTVTGLTSLALALLSRPVLNIVHDLFFKRLMTDSYDENLWEFISAGSKVGLQTIVETNLRSIDGKLLNRPLGSPKKFPNADNLVFNIAQLHRLPTPEYTAVNTQTVLGRMAAKPLKISIPIIISGMAFGLGLNEKARIALCQGCTQAGTAINSGEGPFLLAERKAARHYIFMYDRGKRKYDPKLIKQADAVEIQFGQGAIAGIGHETAYKDISPKARKLLGLKPGQPEITHARVPGINEPRRDLPPLIRYLRELTGGVPIGAKIAAGNDLEKDLEILVEAGVDFIAIDGAEAATKGSPPILQDDFGIPTVFAVNRAAHFLLEQGVKDKVSLIVGGGLYTPGSFMKMLALGADAVYIGTIALFAMAHTQVLKAMPFEPPPQVVFAQSHFADRLNVKKAADSLAYFLIACNEEIMEGVRALGKTSLADVNRQDLAALEPQISEALGIPLASSPN